LLLVDQDRLCSLLFIYIFQVPAEFIVQRNTNANPPTLFLAIDSIITSFNENNVVDRDKEFLTAVFPRLKVSLEKLIFEN